MKLGVEFAAGERRWPLAELSQPLVVDELLAGIGPWEVEIGFGKGRYLLELAARYPDRRFLGVEVVSKYYRLALRRTRRRELGNVLLARGEALYLLAAVLPRGFARTLHVYFPDPWPKSRHHRRRLFDPETVDLVLGTLRPGGTLCFATDFIAYGERVREILEGFPGLLVEPHAGLWPDGARTNYEAKYIEEGRPILRLTARLVGDASGESFHPAGRAGIVAATAVRDD